mmetsp:Transcript_25910/g.21332  ORF Transcript_25910/g.21332 Transcript_25910/m.21332 type:complete len:82 (+) Transcript_25910:78-323(+)
MLEEGHILRIDDICYYTHHLSLHHVPCHILSETPRDYIADFHTSLAAVELSVMAALDVVAVDGPYRQEQVSRRRQSCETAR